MIELNNFQLSRGINPNLAAGERAIKLASKSNASLSNPYRFITVPNNPFYNFSEGSFTIYMRFLHLGEDYNNGYGHTAKLMAKNSSGHGWQLSLSDADYKPTMQFGNANTRIYDKRGLPLDGQWHSFGASRVILSEDDKNDISKVFIYKDGSKVTLAYRGEIGNIYNFDSSSEVVIGGADFFFMRGYIDYAMFSSSGFTDEEMFNMENSATRIDRGCKFIADFNQITAQVIPGGIPGTSRIVDSSSVSEIVNYYGSEELREGRAFIKVDGIRTFPRNSTLSTPLNGHFTPKKSERITGISKFDEGITEAQYSLNGTTWIPISFDATGMSNNLPAYIQLDAANPTLYLRASNANPSYLNALELHY